MEIGIEQVLVRDLTDDHLEMWLPHGGFAPFTVLKDGRAVVLAPDLKIETFQQNEVVIVATYPEAAEMERMRAARTATTQKLRDWFGES
jgi:hypothetical protein